MIHYEDPHHHYQKEIGYVRGHTAAPERARAIACGDGVYFLDLHAWGEGPVPYSEHDIVQIALMLIGLVERNRKQEDAS